MTVNAVMNGIYLRVMTPSMYSHFSPLSVSFQICVKFTGFTPVKIENHIHVILHFFSQRQTELLKATFLLQTFKATLKPLL